MASSPPDRTTSSAASSVSAARVPMLLFGAIFAFVGGIELSRGKWLEGIAQAGFGLVFIVWIEATHRGHTVLARVSAVVAGVLWVLWFYTILFS